MLYTAAACLISWLYQKGIRVTRSNRKIHTSNFLENSGAVLPERGSEAGAGARKRVFQKMAGSEAWSEAFIYIYIYIYSKENM